MLQRGGELGRDVTRRTGVDGGGDQLWGDAGEGAVEAELGAAPEIERKLLDLDLGAFRGIDDVQFALVDRDTALRQPFAVHPALTQREVEPRALSRAPGEVDPCPQRAGNRRRDVLQLKEFRNERRD